MLGGAPIALMPLGLDFDETLIFTDLLLVSMVLLFSATHYICCASSFRQAFSEIHRRTESPI